LICSILSSDPVRTDATVILGIQLTQTMISLLYNVGNFLEYIFEFGDPLYLARNYKIAKLLIKNGADPIGGYRGSDEIPTILHHLCFTRSKGAMQAVLESGTPVNIPNSLGKTPMFYAPNSDIVDLLFNAGHSVDWEDITGFRPLHHKVNEIVCNENLLTVKALLDAKCDPNAEDSKGRTPLHIVCLQGKARSHDDNRSEVLQNRLDTIKLLADYGARFTAEDNEGKTPFDCLYIPRSEADSPEWKVIADYLIEKFDAQVNHGFKK